MRLSTRRAVVVIALLLALAATGCEVGNSSRRKTEAATAEDINAMREQLGRLSQDVEALENELNRSDRALRNELAAVQRAINDLDTKSASQVATTKRELAGKINEIERKRVDDKNALNRKMDAIVAEVQRALGAGSSTDETGLRRWLPAVRPQWIAVSIALAVALPAVLDLTLLLRSRRGGPPRSCCRFAQLFTTSTPTTCGA